MQSFGKKVDARHTDAVQSARNLVSVRIELSAGVQLGHDDFGGGLPFFLHHVHRNAAAVINHRDRVVEVNHHFNRVAITCQRFIDRIINNFVNQVMESQLAGRSDVHRGPFAHGFATFKNGDSRSVISLFFVLQF